MENDSYQHELQSLKKNISETRERLRKEEEYLSRLKDDKQIAESKATIRKLKVQLFLYDKKRKEIENKISENKSQNESLISFILENFPF